MFKLEFLGKEGGPAEVGGDDAADGVGGHEHVGHDDLQPDGLQRRRATQDEPRHGAGESDEADRLDGVDDGGQSDPQRPPHLLQRRLPRRRTKSKRSLHLQTQQNGNFAQSLHFLGRHVCFDFVIRRVHCDIL